MASQDFCSPFTLWYSTYSICATMVRTTFAMRGDPAINRPDMDMKFNLVDISSGNPEQFSENYLCHINPLGQVPVLVNRELLPKPMPESMDISWYLCDWYPGLVPVEHKKKIEDLMAKLHEVDYGILTFGWDTPHLPHLKNGVKELMETPGISTEYKKALEFKYSVLEKTGIRFSPDAAKKHEMLTKQYLAKIASLIETSQKHTTPCPYIFGSEPTVLDAHTLVFICRMCDIQRRNLVPESLQKWTDNFRETEVWKQVVPGGSTLPPYAARK